MPPSLPPASPRAVSLPTRMPLSTVFALELLLAGALLLIFAAR